MHLSKTRPKINVYKENFGVASMVDEPLCPCSSLYMLENHDICFNNYAETTRYIKITNQNIQSNFMDLRELLGSSTLITINKEFMLVSKYLRNHTHIHDKIT